MTGVRSFSDPFIEATSAEEDTLWLMLTYAASMNPAGVAQIPVAQADPHLRSYVQEWGNREGDLGLIARSSLGEDLGAAWLRMRTPEEGSNHGYRDLPELALAVIPEARGRGLGQALLEALIERARHGCSGIVLSVREHNPAVHLYLRTGFQEVRKIQNRVGGTSLLMKLDLVPNGPAER